MMAVTCSRCDQPPRPNLRYCAACFAALTDGKLINDVLPEIAELELASARALTLGNHSLAWRMDARIFELENGLAAPRRRSPEGE